MSETKIIKVKVGEGKEIAIEAALIEAVTYEPLEKRMGGLQNLAVESPLLEAKASKPIEERMGVINLPDMSSVCESIEAFASSINSTIDKVKPTKATVEFGFKIGLDNENKLSALLVSGKAEANLNIALEWESK